MHTSPGPAPPRRPMRAARIGVIALLLLAVVAAGMWAARRGGPAHAARAAGAQSAAAAVPDGAFTLLDGKHATLAALRGRPVMLWFVAAGCASCAASIPAVGQHLAAFRAARTRILVLGLYGAFGQGATELAGFGKAAAGKAFGSPAWTWGLASEHLTATFDPSGTPDAYFLLDAAGHIVYQNSVPVSTMSALLGHLPAAAR